MLSENIILNATANNSNSYNNQALRYNSTKNSNSSNNSIRSYNNTSRYNFTKDNNKNNNSNTVPSILSTKGGVRKYGTHVDEGYAGVSWAYYFW